MNQQTCNHPELVRIPTPEVLPWIRLATHTVVWGPDIRNNRPPIEVWRCTRCDLRGEIV